MPTIELENVYKAYDGMPVLQSLDLRVETGEIYGLLGLNGAGKSTLIHLLLGFLRPQQGRIRVLGATDLKRNEGRIGYVPEQLRYHLRFSAREYMRMLGKLDGMREPDLSRRIDAELESVGLITAANRRLSTYSRGMLQRVGIAQALLNEPKLLLVDEPTGGLDPSGQHELMSLFLELRGRGVSVLLATHYLDEVEQVCDRVGILYGGRIAAETEVSTLRTASSSVLITTAAMPAVVVERLARLTSAVQINGPDLLIAPNSPELQNRVLRLLLDAGVTVLALQPQQRPLAELFRQVTSGEAFDKAYAPRTRGNADEAVETLPNGLFAPPGHPDAGPQRATGETLLRELLRSEEQD